MLAGFDENHLIFPSQALLLIFFANQIVLVLVGVWEPGINLSPREIAAVLFDAQD